MAEAARAALLGTFKQLLDTGAFSDLTVTCGPDTYKLHKNIVCSRADFFARAIKFGGKEAKEGTINLPEDEPAIIRLLIAYIYKGKYEPALQDPQAPTIVSSTEKEKNRRHALLEIAFTFPHTCHAESADSGPMIHRCKLLLCSHHACSINCSNSCKGFTCSKCIRDLPDDEPSNHLLTHAKMYEIADKYDVAGLKDLVTENFRNACKNFWSSPTFAIAAYYAFSTTPDSDKGLRDIVVKTIADHMAELVKKPEIENLLTEFNGLALGLLKAKTKASWW